MDTAFNPGVQQLLAQNAAEIAGTAHVHQLKRITELMRALVSLAGLGFVVTGFEARAGEPITVWVDDPADELVDRAAGAGPRGGKFDGARGSHLWIAACGVRVCWEVIPDRMPRPAGFDLNALRDLDSDPRT